MSIFSKVYNRENSLVTRKDKIFKIHPELDKKYSNYDLNALKKLKNERTNLLKWIDNFCGVTDIIIITWLYFDHFDLLLNNFAATENSDRAKFICLCLSILVCIAIVIRYFIRNTLEDLNFILNIRHKGKNISLKF